MKNKTALGFCGLLLGTAFQAFAGAAPDPVQLLKDADRSRGAAPNGISWNAVVQSIEDGNTHRMSYHIKVQADDALAEAFSPPRNKGEITLFNDRNIWFFKPGLRKPISISPRQKLLGQAANGDIASTNYARDYEGTIAGEETFDGKASWKLELKAKVKNVTYDRIRYWISKADRLGIKAEFLTVGGEVFKRADFVYKNKLTSGGRTFPFISLMTITDALNPENKTTLLYESPREERHGPALFNVNNLIR